MLSYYKFLMGWLSSMLWDTSCNWNVVRIQSIKFYTISKCLHYVNITTSYDFFIIIYIDCMLLFFFLVKHGGLNLIDLEDATKSLLVRWLVKAFEGGKTHLHILIQYRLERHALIEKKMKPWSGMDVS